MQNSEGAGQEQLNLATPTPSSLARESSSNQAKASQHTQTSVDMLGTARPWCLTRDSGLIMRADEDTISPTETILLLPDRTA